MGAETTNARLGYPDDARLLIVNADDFGMCHSVNTAVSMALLDGIVSSTTLMVPCPWAQQALHFLSAHPEIPFGVHLTMVCDSAIYRWKPMTSAIRVPTLVDESGYFYLNHQRTDLLARVDINEVQEEFRAQIETVLAAQLFPTHVDWHCLADGGREDIFRMTFDLAREYGLALRVHEQEHAETLQRQGYPTSDHGVLDSYHMETTEKTEQYLRLLKTLPPGLSEWAVHPSLGNAESQALEPDSWQVRRADIDFLLAPEARVALDEGITLISYRELQQLLPHFGD